ncbi:helix-turn-helix transcriptional regulator [Arcanobacterium phocae]|uniref:DNA-binding transcriptional regulator, XRE-family HTH domain n=1 Tax=Arcanobacterium phocae TaxID=131112 RepID=A0A1H2LJ28_9ACTO|nr:helix-turn-helix transcriptional regulator [Arcanobacterium phocae]SDU80814.1 DNA-binding transcriptional regulator, XRE-family HTH domain [Arcanobacterium phocae]
MAEYSYAERVLGSVLGKTLARRRKELGKTQEQVANEAQINREHYQQMEYGRSDRKRNSPLNPRLSTLLKLSAVLDTEVEVLLRDAIAAYRYTQAHEEQV